MIFVLGGYMIRRNRDWEIVKEVPKKGMNKMWGAYNDRRGLYFFCNEKKDAEQICKYLSGKTNSIDVSKDYIFIRL